MFLIFAFSLAYLFFIAAVIALGRARASKLRELNKKNYFCARFARKALIRAERLIHSCQLGLFFSAIAAGISLAIKIDPLLNSGDVALLSQAVPEEFKLVVFWSILLVYLCLSFPAINAVRVVALARPNRTLCYLSAPLLVFSKLIEPISDLVILFVKKVASVLGITPISEREQFASADEINELIEKSTKAGRIDEDEGEMIRQVFTFSSTLVREVMTPRKDVIYVDSKVSLDNLIKFLKGEKFSRLLVCAESLDNVLGVLHSKDLIPLVGRRIENFDIMRFVKPAFFVPNTKNVDQLLEEFKMDRIHFAVVLDEHGAVDGVVTLEDLIEELVGEILDEYDEAEDEPDAILKQGEDSLVDAGMLVEDFNDFTDFIKLPEGPYDTVAGFIINTLGSIPQVGAHFEFLGHTFSVEQMEDNRITRVKISKKSNQLAA
jgi:putative hemolysin